MVIWNEPNFAVLALKPFLDLPVLQASKSGHPQPQLKQNNRRRVGPRPALLLLSSQQTKQNDDDDNLATTDALVSRLLHFARLEAFRYVVHDVAHLVHEKVRDNLLVAGVLAAAGKARSGHVMREESDATRRECETCG